jgi:hypothetical protein
MGTEHSILAKSAKSLALQDLKQHHDKAQIIDLINKGDKTFNPEIKIQQANQNVDGG